MRLHRVFTALAAVCRIYGAWECLGQLEVSLEAAQGYRVARETGSHGGVLQSSISQLFDFVCPAFTYSH